MPRRRVVMILLAVLVIPAAARAQFTQYSRPGSFELPPEQTYQLLERAIEESKWRVGRFYIDPWVALREIAYDDNVGNRTENQVSDFTVTLGAGLRGFVPIGEDLIFSAHLLPEYVWWSELDQRNRLNGRGGAGLFGSVGRVDLEASVTRVDEARFFSREFEDQVNTQDDLGALILDIDIGRGFSFVTGGSYRRLRFLEDDEDVEPVKVLDRDEGLIHASLHFTTNRGIDVGLGVEQSDVSFEELGNVRDNSGLSPIASLKYDGTRLQLAADMASRSLDFDEPALDFDGLTGRIRAEWLFSYRVGFQAYTSRNVVYSFSDSWAYFDDRVQGVALRSSLNSWLGIRAFVEVGDNRYTPLPGQDLKRVDDFDGFGAEFRIKMNRVVLVIEAASTSYTSSIPSFDRDVTIIRSGVVFTGTSISPWG